MNLEQCPYCASTDTYITCATCPDENRMCNNCGKVFAPDTRISNSPVEERREVRR
jgi:hypothetical protein